MFFGAGNVIFPPFLGMEAGSRWLEGFSAYFIADIGLAMMGMFALLRVGSSEQVLRRAGKLPAEILMCAIVLCIGPMVAIPRTSASTYEMAIAPNLSGVSPVVFSVAFFALILVLCLKESAVVDIVGKILTPLLLLAVYMGLAYLGATVSTQYTGSIGRAALIMAIVEALMGKTGVVIFGAVVGLACVTTAIALTSSAAAYFSELCRGKVSYKVFVASSAPWCPTWVWTASWPWPRRCWMSYIPPRWCLSASPLLCPRYTILSAAAR